ncbi:MAG: serine/threonine-protein kinase [Pyrinomonadaceae bacterium]
MNADRFAKVKEIYTAVLDISPDERDSYLCLTCGDDEELRDELNSLLAFEDTFDSVIDTPPDSLAAEIMSCRDEPDFTGADIGRYKVTSQIGRGGMSTVYLAEDKLLERKVAVKFLNKEFSEFPDRLDRFLSEAKSASSLNHPNIITVYEVGENDGTYFIVTEHIAGETLRKRLGDGRLDADSVVSIAVQIASALDAAHSAGIIHRDIKPDNIMIRPDGLVKILDFGIAKMAEHVGSSDTKQQARFDTTPGTIVGTTDYMSPEQVRGEGVTAQTDIFSFGIVLFEMLTGTLPFTGSSRSDVMASILTLAPNLPDRTDIPGELISIVDRSLRKERRQRYQSAGEIHDELLKFQKAQDLNQAIEHSLGPDVRDRVGRKGIASYFETSSKAARSLVLSLVVIVGLGFAYWYFTAENDTQIRSIAVMPFVNKSNNADNEVTSLS